MAAAVEAFGTAGYASTSIEQLCTAAGISTRNFYEEFGGREALLIAIHDELNQRALMAVGQALVSDDGDDLERRARAGLTAYFQVMTTDRRLARIAIVESVGVSPAAEAHRRTAIGRFADVLKFEADRLAGLGLAPARDFALTAVALVGAINGLVGTWSAEGDWDARVDDIVEEAVALIVPAITLPRERPAG